LADTTAITRIAFIKEFIVGRMEDAAISYGSGEEEILLPSF
jgi:hypothetical protein